MLAIWYHGESVRAGTKTCINKVENISKELFLKPRHWKIVGTRKLLIKRCRPVVTAIWTLQKSLRVMILPMVLLRNVWYRVGKITCFCFNYNCNLKFSITITMKRFSKQCYQFTYICCLEFCLRQHCGFVL